MGADLEAALPREVLRVGVGAQARRAGLDRRAHRVRPDVDDAVCLVGDRRDAHGEREAVRADERKHGGGVLAAQAVEARIPDVEAALGRRVALLRLFVVAGADLFDVCVVQRRLGASACSAGSLAAISRS
jgi:hypothetical protein